jgi:hypothetical protein
MVLIININMESKKTMLIQLGLSQFMTVYKATVQKWYLINQFEIKKEIMAFLFLEYFLMVIQALQMEVSINKFKN